MSLPTQGGVYIHHDELKMATMETSMAPLSPDFENRWD